MLAEPTLVTALCGCIMDDIPRHLKEAFIQLGFDKSTDHFYGEFVDKVFRVYIDKDERGFTKMTAHYPLKFKSEQEATKAIDRAKELLAGASGEATIIPRENWLDLILTFQFGEGLEKIALDRTKFDTTIKEILIGFANVVDKIVS